MNVKINDKQANRTTEDKTTDPTFDENKFLTNCLTVAFDEIFADEIFCCTVVVTDFGYKNTKKSRRKISR